MELQFHEYANLFPLIEGREFDDLVADIQQHGIREPIWLYDGKILDGRNRYRASQSIGIDAPIKTYEGDDALAFVISLNLKRRHLNESQRAMVAAKLAKLELGANQHTGSENLPTQQQAANMLNVSDRSIRTAKHVQSVATPELAAAVEAGKVAVSAAAQATKIMTPEQQRQTVADGSLAKAVAELRRAEAKQKEVERVIAEAPKFSEDEKTKIKEMMGAPGDGDIFSRIDEILDLILEQPDADTAAERIPESLAHAINTQEIHVAAKWLLDFCTAWEAKRMGISIHVTVNKDVEYE